MKNLLLFLVLVSWVSCSSSPEPLIISNTSSYDWTNKNIVISSSELSIEPGLLPVLEDKDGMSIPSQTDDIDGDGIWDEMAFQMSIPAGSSSEVLIEAVDPQEYPTYTNNTQVHLGFSPERNGQFESVEQNSRPETHVAQSTPYLYQYEGPGWESNLVAFRSYFDSRNGKDIFGKRTAELVANDIGIDENYHAIQPWGMDILKVGGSLGAGALAIKKNGELIRLGETESAEFRKIYEGPVRSSFQLTYQGWDVKGEQYEVKEVITIWAHKRWYNSTIQLSPNAADTMVTGIVNLFDMNATTVDTSNFKLLYTHGLQSEHQDVLGMAIFVSDKIFNGFSQAPASGNGITNTELVYLKPDNGKYSFYFYAGWEGENSEFSDLDYFKSQIIKEVQQLPVKYISL